MKISSRFSIAVHILALLSLSRDEHCTSKWIDVSVGTHLVRKRRVLGPG